jgi:hypothetical protein
VKIEGNRWATALTTDVLGILNHAENTKAMGITIQYTHPYWEVIDNKEQKSQPFLDSAIGVREIMLLEPLTRQVLFQRFGYTMPHYAQINHHAPLNTSQFTHLGLIVQDDSKQTLQFYEQILGLLRVRDNVETSYESSDAGRGFFDLQAGEKFIVTAVDDPCSCATNFIEASSRRLYIVSFPENIKLQSHFTSAQPGSLGMCLYTYQVQGIETYFDRIRASNAQKVTKTVNNEFGEMSYSFIAPDGYFWTLVAKN